MRLDVNQTNRSRRPSGFSLLELVVSTGVASTLFACAMIGVVALQRSAESAKRYAAGMNDGCRLVDYIARDLRNANRISRIDNGAATPFKINSLEISATSQLSIFAPNYFLSNVPDNASGSSYKTPRFSRSLLPTGQTYFPYSDVVTVEGTSRYLKYPGDVEYRYIKKPRSAADPTLCYFRQVFENGALKSEREIVSDAEPGRVVITALDVRRFQIVTSFAPYVTGERTRDNTRQFCTVQLPNRRKDL